VLSCTIWTGAVPAGVIAGGYSQAQNDADKTDFETNFKPYANRSIDAVPSRIFATIIKAVIGGGQTLAVDGSVTPVVFEYNPAAGFDVEVTALSLLFEDTTAFLFGNKFILTGLNTLANGLLLEVKAGGEAAVTWQNMKRTRDLVEISSDFNIVTGTTNHFRAKIHLPRPIRLARAGTFGTADFIRLTVRDNLTTFDAAEAHIQGVKL